MKRHLTPKEDAFARAIVSGHSPSEAYRMAGYSTRGTAATIASEASRIQARPQVVEQIDVLRERAESQCVLSNIEMRERCARIARDPRQPAAAVIAAVMLDATLAGELKPRRSRRR